MKHVFAPSTTRRNASATLLSMVLTAGLLITLSTAALGRPVVMKPDVPFFSDAYVEKNGISDIGPEKNYEEVYRNYNYYQAVYDAKGRVVKFTVFKRGEKEREETYAYTSGGVEKTTTHADGRKETSTLRP
ncbi:MAG: hypothetical protein OEZ59_08480 [Deltaproteobacteria bacterium]|nr:hypothetical protein [Deltaproteobacteria bacterium]